MNTIVRFIIAAWALVLIVPQSFAGTTETLAPVTGKLVVDNGITYWEVSFHYAGVSSFRLLRSSVHEDGVQYQPLAPGMLVGVRFETDDIGPKIIYRLDPTKFGSTAFFRVEKT